MQYHCRTQHDWTEDGHVPVPLGMSLVRTVRHHASSPHHPTARWTAVGWTCKWYSAMVIKVYSLQLGWNQVHVDVTPLTKVYKNFMYMALWVHQMLAQCWVPATWYTLTVSAVSHVCSVQQSARGAVLLTNPHTKTQCGVNRAEIWLPSMATALEETLHPPPHGKQEPQVDHSLYTQTKQCSRFLCTSVTPLSNLHYFNSTECAAWPFTKSKNWEDCSKCDDLWYWQLTIIDEQSRIRTPHLASNDICPREGQWHSTYTGGHSWAWCVAFARCHHQTWSSCGCFGGPGSCCCSCCCRYRHHIWYWCYKPVLSKTKQKPLEGDQEPT